MTRRASTLRQPVRGYVFPEGMIGFSGGVFDRVVLADAGAPGFAAGR